MVNYFHHGFFIMALASLSRVSVLNIKPPALRVESKGYTKKNTFPL